jgi:two-component system response regulator HydG
VKVMLAYDWPGNVRELENCLERACALTTGPVIHVSDVPTSVATGHGPGGSDIAPASKIISMAEVEKRTILEAIEQLNGDKLLAARLLGIGKTTLYRKLKEYGSREQTEMER